MIGLGKCLHCKTLLKRITELEAEVEGYAAAMKPTANELLEYKQLLREKLKEETQHKRRMEKLRSALEKIRDERDKA